MRLLNFLIIPLVFIILGFPQLSSAEEKIAPDFVLKDINGKEVRLSDFRGKVVLLNFWATWCDVCINEMDSLNKAYQNMKEKGFVVVAISIDRSEKVVKEFARHKGLNFPVLMDPEKEVYFDKYAIFGLPTSFLIDKKGYIRERYIGEKDWLSNAFTERVIKLINE